MHYNVFKSVFQAGM